MSEITTEQATEVAAPQSEAPATQVDAPKAEPKVFDEAYVKELRDEAASYRVKAKEYQEQLKNAKSIEEVQKITADYERTIHERDALIRQRDVRIIALEYGIPDDLQGRLVGDTEEDLRKDAAKLADLLGVAKKSTPKPRNGQPSGGLDPVNQAPAIKEPDEAARDILRRKRNIF